MARTQGQTTKGESVKYHTPALLQEVIDLLDPKPDKKFIDATIGGGGHTLAIEHVKKEVHSSQFTVHSSGDLVLVQENFNRIGQIAKEKGFEKVNGILFDYGDANALKKALQKLLNNPKIRHSMQKINKKKSRRFLWTDIANKLEKIYIMD